MEPAVDRLGRYSQLRVLRLENGQWSVRSTVASPDDAIALVQSMRAASSEGLFIVFDDVQLYGSEDYVKAVAVLSEFEKTEVVAVTERAPVAVGFSSAALMSTPFLTAKDLCWREQDTLGYVAQRRATHAANERASRIHEKVEGWPAGAIFLSTRDLVDDHVDGTSLELFILETFLPEMSEALIGLMPRFALCDRLDTELAVQVFGDDAILALDEARELMLLTVDKNGFDFRHQNGAIRRVFAGQCDDRSRRKYLFEAARLRRERGDFEEAIEYAVRAGQTSMALAWIDMAAETLVRDRGRIADYVSWIERLSVLGAELSIEARIWYVWALRFSLRVDDAEAALQVLLDDAGGATGIPENSRFSAKIAQLQCSIASGRDQTAAVIEKGTAWLKKYSDAQPFDVATVAGALSFSQYVNGDRLRSLRSLEIARRHALMSQSHNGIAWIAVINATFLIIQGEFENAERVLVEECFRLGDELKAGSGILELATILMARVRSEANDERAAQRYFDRGRAKIGAIGLIEIAAIGVNVGVWLAEKKGGFDKALDFLDRAQVATRRYPNRISLYIYRERIVLALRNGRISDAREWLDIIYKANPSGEEVGEISGAGIFQFDDRQLVVDQISLLQIFVLAMEGKIEQANEMIRPLELRLESNRQHHAVFDLKIVSAYLSWRSGKQEKMTLSLERAMEIADNHGMRRAFDDLLFFIEKPLGEYLRRKPDAKTSTIGSQLSDLGERLGVNPTVWLDDAPLPPSDDLTNKEEQVLRLVDEGFTNGKIAESLDVSVATVKWHLQNLYRKLNVRNRSGAVSTARRLGLLG